MVEGSDGDRFQCLAPEVEIGRVLLFRRSAVDGPRLEEFCRDLFPIARDVCEVFNDRIFLVDNLLDGLADQRL